MAIFLENAALYDDLNAMFLGTLEALTASIDAKDRYTCGHSRRVAHLTRSSRKASAWTNTPSRRMHIAGLVHDVGKIGVPEAVLLKPGKLNAEEFDLIRKHPEIGYRILKDIPQLNDILPGVLHHHERWDGGGLSAWPAGRGDSAGRPIDRPCRFVRRDELNANLSLGAVATAGAQRNCQCIGSQFDPMLAEAFLSSISASSIDWCTRSPRRMAERLAIGDATASEAADETQLRRSQHSHRADRERRTHGRSSRFVSPRMSGAIDARASVTSFSTSNI